MNDPDVTGLTPQQWATKLEEVVEDRDRLQAVLGDLDREMRQEKSWIHEHPEPSGVVATLLSFFGRSDDDDVEALGKQLKGELNYERSLRERYRSWKPGEKYDDLIFPFVKDFAAPVQPDDSGLQFPGYLKLKGVRRGKTLEMWVFYISERFPGREPANFHVFFDPRNGELIIKRVYKMDLPAIEGIAAVGRSVLEGMIRELTDVTTIREIEIDNAANVATREALMTSCKRGDGVHFCVKDGADAAKTPLGHLMKKLSVELGLEPGNFRIFAQPYGMLRLELSVRPLELP
ncbi:MAG: hypothetical protein A2289_01400 [Deltaproteobacteria bacterium RIFOXYA12_FULL_58_15]|nr:MAG: hypothetical protein A2289_01400 [Deltaproteobacteria bacterium RIFOXYA12_FULL_58_15]OGR14044.1 MAG: hypothetical protein A2341_19055 [Deltaproteobacteria bacterium RIFOXYB12_FULL_58_9]